MSTEKCTAKNVGVFERGASVIGGGTLIAKGIARGGVTGFIKAVLGGGLVYRGLTGTCSVYKSLGINSAVGDAHVCHSGIKVEQSIQINKPREVVFAHWKALENLPRVMTHLKSITQVGSNLSRWSMVTAAGQTIYWDAKIINCVNNELIAWRSVKGAALPNVGSVHFDEEVPGVTTVKLSLQYYPHAGKMGADVVKLFGDDPEQRIGDDLKRFKEEMESN